MNLTTPTPAQCIGKALLLSTVADVECAVVGDVCDEAAPVKRDCTYKITLADETVVYRTGSELVFWYRDETKPNGCDIEGCATPATFLLDAEPADPMSGKFRACDAHLVTLCNEFPRVSVVPVL